MSPQKGNKMPRLWYESETEEEYNASITLSPYDMSTRRMGFARGVNSLKEIVRIESHTKDKDKVKIITIFKNDREHQTLRPIKEYRLENGKIKFLRHIEKYVKVNWAQEMWEDVFRDDRDD